MASARKKYRESVRQDRELLVSGVWFGSMPETQERPLVQPPTLQPDRDVEERPGPNAEEEGNLLAGVNWRLGFGYIMGVVSQFEEILTACEVLHVPVSNAEELKDAIRNLTTAWEDAYDILEGINHIVNHKADGDDSCSICQHYAESVND
jgi:hypothetical protein